MSMIDWVTAKITCTHNPDVLSSGRSIRTKKIDGIEHLEYEICNRLSVKGSHDANITIRSHTDNTIEISGNPAKFLQGHNIFGTNDLKYLVAKLMDKLFMMDELELKPTETEYNMIQEGHYRLSRVDVNAHFAFPSAQLARSWLRAAGRSANMMFRGAGLFREGTLYFTPESRRFVPKIYFKYDEIFSKDKNHRLPDKLLQIPELVEYAEKSLRFEIKILSTQLNDWMLHLGCNWTSDVATMLINDQFISKLQLSENMALDQSILETLPKSLTPVYALWEQGQDLRRFYSKTAFYRWRTRLLEYGIDISVVKDSDQSNIVPMIRYLEAVPMGIPDWAYQKGLVA